MTKGSKDAIAPESGSMVRSGQATKGGRMARIQRGAVGSAVAVVVLGAVSGCAGTSQPAGHTGSTGGHAVTTSSLAATTSTTSSVGTTPSTAGPLTLPAPGQVTSAAGPCALFTSGEVECWGSEGQGQEGGPVVIAAPDGTGALTDVVSLVEGAMLGASDTPPLDSECAVLSNGQVVCWEDSNVQAVPGIGGQGLLSGVQSVTSGSDAFCALLVSGQAACWGDNSEGALGDGSAVSSQNPVTVLAPGGKSPLTGIRSIASSIPAGGGDQAFCATLVSGGVDCWGNDDFLDLGPGPSFHSTTPGYSSLPVPVVDITGTGSLSGVASVTGGSKGFCATLSSGGVDCWGNAQHGRLGDRDHPCVGQIPVCAPTQVLGVGGTGTLGHVVSVAAQWSGTFCALLTSGQVACWGRDDLGQLGNAVNTPDPIYSTEIQPLDQNYPTLVAGVGGRGTLTGVKSVVGIDLAFCAVLTNGTAACWGSNEGDLGAPFSNGPQICDSTTGQVPCTTSPLAVQGVGGQGLLAGITAVEWGGGNSNVNCAVLQSGGMACWGKATDNQLGGQPAQLTGQDSLAPVAVDFGQ